MSKYKRTHHLALFVLFLELFAVNAQLFANVELDAAILDKLKGKSENTEGIIRPDRSDEVKISEEVDGQQVNPDESNQDHSSSELKSGSLPPSEPPVVSSESFEETPDFASTEEVSHPTPPEEKSLPLPSPIPPPPQQKPVSNVLKENPFKPDTREQDIRSLISQLMTSGGDPKSSVSQIEESLGIPAGALLKRKKDEGNQKGGKNQRNNGRPGNRDGGESPRNSRNENNRPNKERESGRSENGDRDFNRRDQRRRQPDRRSRNGNSNRNSRDHRKSSQQRRREDEDFKDDWTENNPYDREDTRSPRDSHRGGRNPQGRSSSNRNRDNRRQNLKEDNRQEFRNEKFRPDEDFDEFFKGGDGDFDENNNRQGQSQPRPRSRHNGNFGSNRSRSSNSQNSRNDSRNRYQERGEDDNLGKQAALPEGKEWTGRSTEREQRSRSSQNARRQTRPRKAPQSSSRQSSRSEVDLDYELSSNFDDKFDGEAGAKESSYRPRKGSKSQRSRSRNSKNDFDEDYRSEKDFEDFFNSNFDNDYNFDAEKDFDSVENQQRGENYNSKSSNKRSRGASPNTKRQQRNHRSNSRSDNVPPQSYTRESQPRSPNYESREIERPLPRSNQRSPSRQDTLNPHSVAARYSSRLTDSPDRYSSSERSSSRYNRRESAEPQAGNTPSYQRNTNDQVQRRSDNNIQPREGNRAPYKPKYNPRKTGYSARNKAPTRPYPAESENSYEPSDIDPISYNENSNYGGQDRYPITGGSESGYADEQTRPMVYKEPAKEDAYESTDIDPLAYATTLTDKPNGASDSDYYDKKSDDEGDYQSGPNHARSPPRQSRKIQTKPQGAASNSEHENIRNGNFNDHVTSTRGSSYRDYVLPGGRELNSKTKEVTATDEAEEQCLQMTWRHGRDIEKSVLEQTCGSLRKWGENLANGNRWKPTTDIMRWWQSLTTPEAVTGAALNDVSRAMQITNDTTTLSRQKRSLQLHFGTLRKEYRMMRHEERQAFHKAVNALKSDKIDGESKYDIFVHFHHPYYAPGAYFGPGFFGWHREYLLRFERALQAIDPSVFLPYWDSSIDGLLGDQATDSIMWMETFAGNAFGRVVTGPFADWSAQTAAGKNHLQRNLGWGGQLGLDETNHQPVQDKTVKKIMFSKSLQSLTWFVDPSIEADIQETLRWISGSMADLPYAPSDPLFFMYFSFIDCIWEQSRLRKLTRQARFDFRSDYPNDTVSVGMGMLRPDGRMVNRPTDSFHAALNEMEPFGPLQNIDGVDGDYSRVYACAPRPMCTKKYPHCNTPYLFCDKNSWLCVPKLQLSTDCSNFRHLSPCYNAQCCKIHETYECRERCEDPESFGDSFYNTRFRTRSKKQRRHRPHVIT